eukprot:1963329-Alexandrium_andersonii.AAC.1
MSAELIASKAPARREIYEGGDGGTWGGNGPATTPAAKLPHHPAWARAPRRGVRDGPRIPGLAPPARRRGCKS